MRKSDLRAKKRSAEVETALRFAGRAVDDPDPAGRLLEDLMMMGFVPTPEVEARRRHPAPQAVPGKRTVTSKAAADPVSDCCGAELETAGRVTRYYVCTKCDQPCDAKAS